MSPSRVSSRLSAVTVLSSAHGRQRRAERLIDKRDLKAAVKHGKKAMSYNQRGELNYKYTFADVIYITDLTSRREITAWAVPGAGLDVAKHPISAAMKQEHNEAHRCIKADKSSWTSHTVIIVDQSGSMRKTDVEGGATRSDAVWLTLAIDFVAKKIESGQATSKDVVSIVAMGTSHTVLVETMPHDWILFNKAIDLLRSQSPSFDGNYLPSLDAAEELLLANTYGNCALDLLFFSDGKPSDQIPQKFVSHHDTGRAHIVLVGARIDRLASRFGRRLSVTAVGFAGPSEDFSVLQKLAERPAQFGSHGRFIAAQLNAEALGAAFDSAISSSLQTKSELTAIGGTSRRIVRDVKRKARDTVGQDIEPNDNWFVYRGKSWRNGERLRYDVKGRKWEPMPPLNSDATGVALEVSFFGEGAERLVREFREIGSDGRFTGERLVAKESRFQMDVGYTDRRDIINFHKTFCDTQHRAQRLAKVFNSRLKQLPGYDERTTPLISFLECSVYVVGDRNLGTMSSLVEKQLDPSKYKKWNDNQGGVDGRDSVDHLTFGGMGLGAITEIDDEDEDSEEDDDDSGIDVEESISIEDIPQAFSHFTYRYTHRRFLVCDLQGVLSDSPPMFELTDPVIHFRSRHRRRGKFGRTDHGMDGIVDFFRTHECGPLCRMLNRRWVRRVGAQQRSSHLDGLEEAVSNLTL